MKIYVLKAVSFCILFCVLLKYFTVRYMPEYFADQTWSTTATFQGFYEMDRNSVDVIFLGSSAGSRGFIPQELYNNYGITSYNLSCEQQNMVSSFYWLREALRFQEPSVVILESKFIFEEDGDVFTDVWFRKAFNHMRFSSVKREAVKDICDLIAVQAEADERITVQSEMSWYLPIIRFHSRWEETGKAEGLSYYLEMSRHHELKGFTPASDIDYATDYSPVAEDDTIAEAAASETEREYLERIVNLCKGEGIELILTYNPSTTDSTARHNYLKNFADEKDIVFIDFNTQAVLEEMEYSYNLDNEIFTHANVWGAQKLTNYIGQYLSDRCLAAPENDSQFEQTREAYEILKKECELRRTNDVNEYLRRVIDGKDRYYVFIAVRDDATVHLKDETIDLLRELGLEADLKGEYRCSYIGVVAGKVLAEDQGYELFEERGTVTRDCSYYIKSGGFDYGNTCSIKINGTEYARNARGINIVVFDSETNAVVDRVAFDTWAEGNPVTPVSR